MVSSRQKETTTKKDNSIVNFRKGKVDIENDITNDCMNEDELDEEILDLKELYSNSMMDIQVGQVVSGEIIEINDDFIHVDIKYKSEGIISIEEFGGSVKNIVNKVGDKINVYLENIEDKDGRVVLSKRKADYYFAWDKVAQAYKNNEPIKGRITKRVKGGLQVDINGVYAFLPASQVDINLRQDLDNYVGKEVEMKIIKINRLRNNIVLSRRVILEEKRNENKALLFRDLAEGQIRKGVVKNITHFGAFVDIGGVNGLLHITDISWGRISHPSEILHVGQEVEVKVLAVDKEAGKISLGLKQKSENPWKTITEKYKIGNKVKGKVVSMTDYGAFIELEEGVEGLVHVSEMSWNKRIEHPSEITKIGDLVEVVILAINQNEEKISLGMKQMLPNPWNKLEQEFPVGTKLKRKIKNVMDFGIFIEMIDGIDGFIHISDFSWNKRYSRAQELFKKDDEIEAVILSIDKENQKINLGIKQLEINPWQILSEKYSVNSNHKANIKEINEFGLVVELEKDIEGFIHISQIENKQNRRLEDLFKPGDEILAKVTKIDVNEQKISLSQKAYQEEEQHKDIKDFIENQKEQVATLGEVINKNIK